MPKSENPTSDEVSKPPVADAATTPEIAPVENITKISAEANETPSAEDESKTAEVAKDNPNSDETNPKSESTGKKTTKKAPKTRTKSEKVSPKSDKESVKLTKKDKKSDKPEKIHRTKNYIQVTPRFRAIVVALLCVSLLTSAASLSYIIWDIVRGDTPITFNYGSDGNSTSFVEGSIADIASKVTPGVVSIVTEVNTTGFFGQTSTSTAAGTGMIVAEDGYVLTNKHVIDGANKIQIVLDNGTTYDSVTVVATDPLNDVAFLKINDASNLPTVKLGDSKTIIAGQQVIAIGNALGQFQNTITSGIISGTGRSITATGSDYSSSESLSDMIQTDAAINSGNSGGPLVNAAGEVIGINTATSADADGIGFAIPISSVKGMLKNITANNSADRSYIGVYYVNITPDVAKAYDLPVSSGAYIYSQSQYSAIVKDGPAAKAGLKEKDIITKVNGIKVGSAGSVSSLIGEYAPGDTVQLTVLRDGKERSINVTLGKCPTN